MLKTEPGSRWKSRPTGRSVPCNGQLIRGMRERKGLTQAHLAKVAGYSERLIRKAEAGGPLSPETIEVLAESLSQHGERIEPEDLACQPKRVATEFFFQFLVAEAGEPTILDNNVHPEVHFQFLGSRNEIPVERAGLGRSSFATALRQLRAAIHSLPDPRADIKHWEQDDTTFSQGTCSVQTLPDIAPREMSFIARMQFKEGLIVRCDFFFDL